MTDQDTQAAPRPWPHVQRGPYVATLTATTAPAGLHLTVGHLRDLVTTLAGLDAPDNAPVHVVAPSGHVLISGSYHLRATWNEAAHQPTEQT